LSLSYTWWISSTSGSEILSAILFLFLAVFSVWSIIITSKEFEEKDEWYIAFWYVATIWWFIFNMWLLNLSNILEFWMYLILSLSCFYGWHFLKNAKTKYQHTSLYSMWILTLIIGLFNLIPELNIYSSLAIAYSSLIFGGLYIFNSKKIERLITYALLSCIWAIISIITVNVEIESFKTAFIILALIPAMAWYFISKKSKNEEYIEYWKTYSIFAVAIAGLFVLVDFLKYLDFQFIIYYIPVLASLLYILKKNVSNKIKSNILCFSIGWFIIGYFGLFFSLLGDLYPSPLDTYIFTNWWLFADWIVIKWILATFIFFLGLKISRELEDESMEKRPWFILVILLYSSLLLIISYIIFAIMNDLWMTEKLDWVRAIISSIWWIVLSIHMLLIWIRKWKRFYSEKLLWLLLLFLTVIKIIFYDMETTSTENKIIVLIITGWILMMFSYLVQKNDG